MEKVRINANFHPVINSKEYYDYRYSKDHMESSFINGKMVMMSVVRKSKIPGFFDDEDVQSELARRSSRATKQLARALSMEKNASDAESVAMSKNPSSIDKKIRVLEGKECKIRRMMKAGTPNKTIAMHFGVSEYILTRKVKLMEQAEKQ